tara:strand:- start:743 stop:928 length:186 start_codon:yes stop_codon:yes gene_type:complete
MRKKFFAGMLVKTGSKVLKKVGPKFQEAIKKHKKLLGKYKNKPLDEDAVKQSYKIFTKGKD